MFRFYIFYSVLFLFLLHIFYWVTKMIINYLKNIGYVFVSLLITTLIITIFNYFGILNGGLLDGISIFCSLLSVFIGGYFTGKKANKKGYFEGIKFGCILIIIVLLFNLVLFKNKFNLINILYYISMLFVSMIGSMIGMIRKK